MTEELKPADIFFTRGKGVISWLVRFFTRSIGEPRSKANHVGLVVEGGRVDKAWVVEALSKVRCHRLMGRYGKKRDEIAVFRPVNLTAEEINKIVAESRHYVGLRFGGFKIVLHFLDWMLLGAYLFRRLGRMDKYPICSWVVAYAYKAAGKDFGIAARAAAPDDIWDFIEKNPGKYELVWQRGTMVPARPPEEKREKIPTAA